MNKNNAAAIIDGPEGVLNSNDENRPIKTDNNPPIIENNTIDKVLGKYNHKDLVLKKGKFGLYVTWGDNKKSINNIK